MAANDSITYVHVHNEHRDITTTARVSLAIALPVVWSRSASSKEVSLVSLWRRAGSQQGSCTPR